MNEPTCTRCGLVVRVHLSCGCGAQRVRAPQCRRCTRLQEQLVQLVATVRSTSPTTVAALRRELGWRTTTIYRAVEDAVTAGLITREPGRDGLVRHVA